MEIVVASGIIAVALSILLAGFALGLRIFRAQAEAREAVLIAEEGAEIVRFLRDADWTDNIVSLTAGTNYYAESSGTTWMLTTTDPGSVQGKYTRTIVFELVYRDGSDIAPSGTEDIDARSFTITVTWTGTFGQRSVVLQGYVMNILGDS